MNLPVLNYFLFLGLILVIRRVKKPRAIDAVLLIVFGGFLILSTYAGCEPYFDHDHPVGPYSALIPRLFSGHFDTGLPVDPRLLSLPNPHPPSSRPGIQVQWDMSLYQGKYYLYWGLGPLLAVGIPYHLLTGRYLSEPAHALAFILLAFGFGYFLILRLISRFTGREPSPLDRFIAAGTMSLSSLLAVFAHRIAICEIAIIAAYAFVITAVYFAERGREWPRSFYWSGIAFGLAIATRPTVVFTLLAIAGIAWEAKLWKKFAVGSLPWIAITAVYNFLRFGSPWEFGFRYQTNAVNHLDYFHWMNELLGIVAMIGQPYFTRPDFPFIGVTPFGRGWLNVQHTYLNDSITGMVFVCPFILLTVPRWGRWFRDPANWAFGGLFATSACFLLIDASAGVTLRYEMESLSLIMIASVVWILSRPKTNWLYTLVGYSALFWSLNVGLICSIALDLRNTNTYHPRVQEILKRVYSLN